MNFLFLEKEYPVLSKLGSLAETYLYSDPNSCLIKLGMLCESLVSIIMRLDNVTLPSHVEDINANRIRALKKNGLLPREIDDILYSVRKARNDATHNNYDDSAKCRALLKAVHVLASWFILTYGKDKTVINEFVMPEQGPTAQDMQNIIKKQEADIKNLTLQISSIPSQEVPSDERIKKSAQNNKILTEKDTRVIIDAQLRRVGWEADTDALRYSKGTRPERGRNIAIAEWPTDSKTGDKGFADYAFFVGTKLVAITEAKRQISDIPSVIDGQCKDYAANIKKEHEEYQMGEWSGYKVPFVFATNGREYLKQLETKSGIWFLDLRRNSNIPKALKGWPDPDGIIEMFERDTEAADKKLEAESAASRHTRRTGFA